MNFVLLLAIILVPILVTKLFLRLWLFRSLIDYRKNSFHREN